MWMQSVGRDRRTGRRTCIWRSQWRTGSSGRPRRGRFSCRSFAVRFFQCRCNRPGRPWHLVTGDAALDFEKVEPSEPRLQGRRDVGVLERDGLGETVFQRDPHAHEDRVDRAPDVVEVLADGTLRIVASALHAGTARRSAPAALTSRILKPALGRCKRAAATQAAQNYTEKVPAPLRSRL